MLDRIFLDALNNIKGTVLVISGDPTFQNEGHARFPRYPVNLTLINNVLVFYKSFYASGTEVDFIFYCVYNTCSFIVFTCPIIVFTCPIIVFTCPFIMFTCPFIVFTCPFIVFTCPFTVFTCPFIEFTCPIIVFTCPFILYVLQ